MLQTEKRKENKEKNKLKIIHKYKNSYARTQPRDSWAICSVLGSKRTHRKQ